jgi:hypothetical protein
VPYSVKPNSPRHDAKCPDGFTCYGWRQVHKGGYVRFARARYYHEDLAQWAGLWVYVTLADYLAIDVDVWPQGPWRAPELHAMNQNDWDAAKAATLAAAQLLKVAAAPA